MVSLAAQWSIQSMRIDAAQLPEEALIAIR
jgi:hypothetical protein